MDRLRMVWPIATLPSFFCETRSQMSAPVAVPTAKTRWLLENSRKVTDGVSTGIRISSVKVGTANTRHALSLVAAARNFVLRENINRVIEGPSGMDASRNLPVE